MTEDGNMSVVHTISLVPRLEYYVKTMYRCLTCGASRQYGNAPVPDKEYKPLIKCASCEKAVRHEFVEVARVN